MLCSHLDVVPVEREKWVVDPFDGVVKDGYIYGRGTLDVKDTLVVRIPWKYTIEEECMFKQVFDLSCILGDLRVTRTLDRRRLSTKKKFFHCPWT